MRNAEKLSSKHSLSIHMKEVHESLERQEDFVCYMCGKQLKCEASLKCHMVGVHSTEEDKQKV